MNIIGAGITGLVLGYQTNSPVYGLKPGGQLTGIKKGPRILELDDGTLKLMSSLGLKDKVRPFHVGYLLPDGSFAPAASQEDRRNYYLKTRGIEAEPTKGVMSGGNNILFGWDISEINLVDRLMEKVNFQKAGLGHVSFKTKLVYMKRPDGSEVKLDLDQCISTIPTNSLIRRTDEPPLALFSLSENSEGSIVKRHTNLRDTKFDSYDTVFIQGTVLPGEKDPIPEEYDYVYSTGIDLPVNRITRLKPGQYCFEARSDKYLDLIDYLEGRNIGIGMVETIRFCQIRNDLNLREIGLDMPEYYSWRLNLCGRYARWKHGIKINDIIQEADIYAESMGR